MNRFLCKVNITNLIFVSILSLPIISRLSTADADTQQQGQSMGNCAACNKTEPKLSRLLCTSQPFSFVLSEETQDL